MNCSEFRERIFDDPRPAGHERDCAACADWVRTVERQERALFAARAPAAPDDLWSRIEGEIGGGRVVEFKPPALSPVEGPRRAWLAVAAALIVGIIGFALFSASPEPVKTIEVKVVDASPETSRAFGSVVPTYDDVDTRTAMMDALTSPVRPEGRRK